MSKEKFVDSNISNEVLRALDDLGFENATKIQAEAIPAIMNGKDVIGKSQTGTGKTLAFGIPAVECINNVEKKQLNVLILCPTRELAKQAGEELRKIAKYKQGVKVAEVYGGVPMDRQIVRLKTANIVVGTPGRVMDHMRRKTLKLDALKMIVLDEADEMLDMGFKEDIETILKDTPASRQTVLFSATMPQPILDITKNYQTNPILIEIDRKNVTLDNIEQNYVEVPMGRKTDALMLFLGYYAKSLSIVFCNTKKMVDELTQTLNKHNIKVEGIHGDMNQSQRTKVMDGFKAGTVNVLVATDVAARGIDVNDVEHVINYDIPQNTEYYVHRIGRTGRAGKNGHAITICSGRRQSALLKQIAKDTKSTVTKVSLPDAQDIVSNKKASVINEVCSALEQGVDDLYTQTINDILSRGYNLHKVAAALLQMKYKKTFDVLTFAEVKEQSNNGNKDFAKIIISIGRNSRVAPNHIVGAITEQTSLCGDDVGKIEIFDDYSVVSVPKDKLDEVLDAMIGCKICKKPVIVQELATRQAKAKKKGNDKGKRGKSVGRKHSKYKKGTIKSKRTKK